MPPEIDTDTQEVINLLRGAVATSGLTNAAFARAMGTSGPRLSTYLSGQTRPSAWFCLRARRIAAALDSASRRGLMSAPATASAMRGHRKQEETAWVWRMLLQGRDHLALILGADDISLVGAWEAEPTGTGSIGWDTLLAALTQAEFGRAGLVAPSWAEAERLDEPWLPLHPFLSPARVRSQTPDWLRRLNIYVPARDLTTA